MRKSLFFSSKNQQKQSNDCFSTNFNEVSVILTDTLSKEAALANSVPLIKRSNGAAKVSLYSVMSVFVLLFLGSYNATAQTASFSYTGSNQTFTVPAGVTSLSITLRGGQGGSSGGPGTIGTGGLGGRTTATLAVTPGQVLTLIVGGQGVKPTSLTGGSGGFGGGGKGGNSSGTGNNTEQAAGGGGGRSAIRISGGNTDLITAGGGGGGSVDNYNGGNGGGTSGSAASNQVGATGGGGGTQSSGGSAGTNGQGYNGTAGSQYQGGAGGVQTQGGGGGGGGYYGGGGGSAECNCANGSNNQNSAGGGGSSYFGGVGVSGGSTSGGVNTGNGSISITYVVVCNAGTVAPTLSATTKANVCPATTADLSGLVTSTCPSTSVLEWQTVATGFATGTKVPNPMAVGVGTYYPVCYDATITCYSPAPATGVTVTITTCNVTPSITSAATATTPENVPTTTAVYTVTSTDPNVGQTATYSFETGGVDNGIFAINQNTGAVTFIASPDFETPTDVGGNNVYDIKVKVCDNGTPQLCAIKDVAITVTNVVECLAGTVAPTLSATTKSNVCPATTDDLSGLVTSTCPSTSVLEWQTVATGFAAGTKVSNPMTVSAGTYYPVCYDATNTCYSPAPSTGVTVTITTCNITPTITSAATATTPENVSTTTPVYTVTSTDPNVGQTATYSFETGGVDNGKFNINPTTGEVTFLASPSFATPSDSGGNNVYDIKIKVCDNGSPVLCDVQDVAITVTNAPACAVGAAVPGLK